MDPTRGLTRTGPLLAGELAGAAELAELMALLDAYEPTDSEQAALVRDRRARVRAELEHGGFGQA